MKLQNLTVKELLEKTAGNDPVPGGGSISALHGAVAAALTVMLANLTIGREKYAEQETQMKRTALQMEECRRQFLNDIDRDSEAYRQVFEAYKLPRETEKEKTRRHHKIQEATLAASLVPLEVARCAFDMLDTISETTRRGNKNAVTDGCVAMMTCRTAVLGALFNVRINLSALKDESFVQELKHTCDRMEAETRTKEEQLVNWVKDQF